MNNDLISREALKKSFDDYIKANPNISGIFELGKIIIDNVPTVDIKDELAGAYNEGYMCGSREAEKARPQNKWIKIFENPFTNGYVCPFCGHKIQVTEQFLPKVTECESCGADMRKGGAE